MQERTLSTIQGNEIEIIGNVNTEFSSFQPLHFIQNKNKIRETAYNRLLVEARRQYGNNVDIVNIVITGRGFFNFSDYKGYPGVLAYDIFLGLGLGASLGFLISDFITPGFYPIDRNLAAGMSIGFAMLGHNQLINATGDVVRTNTSSFQNFDSINNQVNTEILKAINRVSQELMHFLPENTRVAVINISSSNEDLSIYIVDELEFQFVSSRRYTIVDRNALEIIRTEQNFQMSGEVSDATAVSIGQLLGANIVITGIITEIGINQRLSIRALDVRTAEIIAMAREEF